MKSVFLRQSIYILLILCGFAFKADAQNFNPNPLLTEIGRPFADYHETYMHVVGGLLHKDSRSRGELVSLFSEAAAVDNSGEWDILWQIVDNTVRFYESRKGGYTWSTEYTAEDFSGNMVVIAEGAGRKGFRYLKIFALYQAGDGYAVFAQNYERAFACYLEAAAELEVIRTEEFPLRPHIYNQLASLYYTFREYDDAILYYRKIIEDPHVRDNYYSSHFPAMNGLGLCYRNGYEDYEASSSYFMEILEQTHSNEENRRVWEGIAEGNIGYNYFLAGDLDTALRWLIPAVEKITRSNDFPFALQLAINIADIYLKMNDLAEAKKYIDIARNFYNHIGTSEKSSHIYDVLARYYTAIGDKSLATSYIDSILIAMNREEDAFSGLVLRRVEQRLRAADEKIYEQELASEKTRSQTYMRTALIISVALIAILMLLIFTLFFYHRKRKAYRELVRHSQTWAGVDLPEEQEVEPLSTDPEESDKLIMERIEKAMSEEKIYRSTDLTRDTLAETLRFNSYYVSQALNRCTGKNFNTYINEYRVKEAIRIMSEADSDNLTIDGIAFESGFNDRTSFYRSFKKITGLSPGEFRRSLKNKKDPK